MTELGTETILERLRSFYCAGCTKIQHTSSRYVSWRFRSGDGTREQRQSYRLGLRTPSEPTIKWITSVWQVLSSSKASLALCTDVHKKSLLVHVKQQFKARLARLEDPVEWVPVLCETPSDLRRQFPKLFEAAFAGGLVPGTARIDIQSVAAYDSSYGCRCYLVPGGWFCIGYVVGRVCGDALL